MNQNLKTRILTGIIAGSLFLFLLSFRTGFIVLLTIIGILALLELASFFRRAALPMMGVIAVILSNIWALTRSSIYAFKPSEGLLTLDIFAWITVGIYLISGLYLLSKGPLKNTMALLMASIAWPAWSFGLMIMYITREGSHRYAFFVGILLLIWASDIAQYFSGRRWGKHALASTISPKKTVEGWVGGFVGILLISIVNSLWISPQQTFFQWLTIGVIVWIFGTVGDLYESVFKRSVGVKDSGNILPGHGGILDRFDSLIFAFPFIIVWLSVMKW